MKDNIKLLYSHYDPDSGISVVRIQTPEGMFKGKARVHPKDLNTASSYTGCRYAELRAYIKYYKFKARQYQIAVKEMTNFYNQLKQNKDTPKKVIYWCEKRLNNLKELKKAHSNFALEIQKEITTSITERSKIIERINKAKIK